MPMVNEANAMSEELNKKVYTAWRNLHWRFEQEKRFRVLSKNWKWVYALKCLSVVWEFYIFEIFGYSWEKLQHILSAEKFIFIDFFAVKVDGYDVKPGICLYENLCTDSWVDVTSVNFNSKKVLEENIFGWQDILQFFSWASEDLKYLKFPNPKWAL